MLQLSPEKPAKAILSPIPPEKMIFVFGSNEAGRHGAGAARFALENRGAISGRGYGFQGQSFGIPTKSGSLKTLDLSTIGIYVSGFTRYARRSPSLAFQVTCIGCGLAGLKDEQIAPMFRDAPSNCYFDLKWQPYLDDRHQFWGTF